MPPERPSTQHAADFARLLRQQIARSPDIRAVCFAVNRGAPFSGSVTAPCPTLIAVVRGKQNNTFYQQGALTTIPQTPAQLLYIAPSCPDALDWEFPCQRLGLQLRHDRLNMSWNDHTRAGGRVAHPDLWYSRALPTVPEDLLRLFHALEARAIFAPDAPVTLHLTNLIYERVLELVLSPEEFSAQSPDTLAMLQNYLDAHLGQPLSCKTVASIFHLHPDYVSRVFKTEGGFSAYLNRQRIRRARDLLLESHLATAEISRMCGFSHPSYFIRVFRSEFGCTPQDFRRRKH